MNHFKNSLIVLLLTIVVIEGMYLLKHDDPFLLGIKRDDRPLVTAIVCSSSFDNLYTAINDFSDQVDAGDSYDLDQLNDDCGYVLNATLNLNNVIGIAPQYDIDLFELAYYMYDLKNDISKGDPLSEEDLNKLKAITQATHQYSNITVLELYELTPYDENMKAETFEMPDQVVAYVETINQILADN